MCAVFVTFIHPSVGIVGEPLNQFHPVTLTPKGTENEGEEEEEDGEQKVKDTRRG